MIQKNEMKSVRQSVDVYLFSRALHPMQSIQLGTIMLVYLCLLAVASKEWSSHGLGTLDPFLNAPASIILRILVRLSALIEGDTKAAFANAIDPSSEKFKFDSVQQ